MKLAVKLVQPAEGLTANDAVGEGSTLTMPVAVSEQAAPPPGTRATSFTV